MTSSYQKSPKASDENHAESREIRETKVPRANAAMLESTVSHQMLKRLFAFLKNVSASDCCRCLWDISLEAEMLPSAYFIKSLFQSRLSESPLQKLPLTG